MRLEAYASSARKLLEVDVRPLGFLVDGELEFLV
jgi:hypothetical protein